MNNKNKEPKLNIVSGIYLCDFCLDGVGGECHTPGCAMYLNRAPDLPIRGVVIDCGGTVKPINPMAKAKASGDPTGQILARVYCENGDDYDPYDGAP